MLPSTPNLPQTPYSGNESTATSQSLQSLSTTETPSHDCYDNDILEEEEEEDEPFFADATLDLSEAHQIAELPTPEIVSSRSRSLGSTITMNIPPPPRLTTVLSDDGSSRLRHSYSHASNSHCEIMSLDSNNVIAVDGRSTQLTAAVAAEAAGTTTTQHSGMGDRHVDTLNNIHSTSEFGNLSTYRPKAPRHARDVLWAISFGLYIPLSLILLPHLLTESQDLQQEQINYHIATVSMILSAFVGVGLSRILYLTRGGGDGDDVRSFGSRILILCNFLSCLTSPILTLQIYYLDVHDSNPWTILLLLGMIVHSLREVTLFSTHIFNNSSRSRRRDWMDHHHHPLEEEGVVGGGLEITGQRTFCRELMHVTLDVLSRSLRCQSFYRVLVIMVVVQTCLVFYLRGIVLLYIYSTSNPAHGGGMWNGLGLLLALVGGFWMCMACIKIVGLLASGGITAWFAQQSLLLEEMHGMSSSSSPSFHPRNAGITREDLEYGETTSQNGGESIRSGRSNISGGIMPDAYRTVHASAYTSVIDFDDGLDDDYEEFELSPTQSNDSVPRGRGGRTGKRNVRNHADTAKWTGGGSDSPSTVKSFLFSAMTKSLGSIAQCALLSWFAQFLWWFMHEWERLSHSSRRYLPLRSGVGFRGMAVGAGGSEAWRQKLYVVAKRFIRNRTDLALCHVAAYFKSYQRAANDVMALVDGSGK